MPKIDPDPVGFGPSVRDYTWRDGAGQRFDDLHNVLKRYFPSMTGVHVEPAARLVHFRGIIRPRGDLTMELSVINSLRIYTLVARLAAFVMNYESKFVSTPSLTRNPCKEVWDESVDNDVDD